MALQQLLGASLPNDCSLYLTGESLCLSDNKSQICISCQSSLPTKRPLARQEHHIFISPAETCELIFENNDELLQEYHLPTPPLQPTYLLSAVFECPASNKTYDSLIKIRRRDTRWEQEIYRKSIYHDFMHIKCVSNLPDASRLTTTTVYKPFFPQ